MLIFFCNIILSIDNNLDEKFSIQYNQHNQKELTAIIMNTGFQLFQLQNIDSEADQSHKRITEIDKLISNNDKVIQAQTRLENSETEYKKIKTVFDEIDHEIQQKKIKKSQSESNLYGGKVTNPKELQDLQLEITSLTKILSELDDKLLQQLMVLDEAENKINKYQADLKEANSQFETEKSMLTAEKNKLEAGLKNLEVKRSSLLPQVDPKTLDVYNMLRDRKNGFAVAKLEDKCCSACGASLTAGQCQQARSSSQLFYCPNCGRIVYGS